MQPLLDRILSANLILTTLIFYVTARIYLLPKIQEFKPQTILIPILLLHSLRHLGLMFLTRGRSIPACPRSLPIPRRLAISLPPCLLLRQFRWC